MKYNKEKKTCQYSVKDKQTLFILLMYIVVTMTAIRVSNNVCSNKNKSKDVTTTPTVQASIAVYTELENYV